MQTYFLFIVEQLELLLALKTSRNLYPRKRGENYQIFYRHSPNNALKADIIETRNENVIIQLIKCREKTKNYDNKN